MHARVGRDVRGRRPREKGTRRVSFRRLYGEQSGYGVEAPGCLRMGEEGIVMYRRLLAMVVVMTLVAALLPGAALAASVDDKTAPDAAGVSALAADTAPADAREPDGHYTGSGVPSGTPS